eukprot:CAMPEP_0117620674 /NCGR_PEP_ID=MMETSP0784-20121206/87247_1 /TAXON_ID=39447 /ORGANISM="" /LENGTH=94 /DNA_ID=CAMNT_0005424589 /DNA_START=307 /DNA_END=588 /DNA_ORIENTATION=+
MASMGPRRYAAQNRERAPPRARKSPNPSGLLAAGCSTMPDGGLCEAETPPPPPSGCPRNHTHCQNLGRQRTVSRWTLPGGHRHRRRKGSSPATW